MKDQYSDKVRGKPLRVLGVTAHPDDLEIGCGGALLKMHRAGHEIYVVVMTFGEAGGAPEVRRKEQDAASKTYGVKQIYWMGHEDTRVRVDRSSIDALDKVLGEVKPDIVFSHYGQDTHQDHRNTAQLVLSVSRYMSNVLLFETPTTVGFTPEVFVDITGLVEDKCRLLRKHESQWRALRVGDLTVVDCIRSMARFRGVQGRIKAAEGFVPLRLVLNM